MLARKTVDMRTLAPQAKAYVPAQVGAKQRAGTISLGFMSRELRSVFMLIALAFGFLLGYEYLAHAKIDSGYELVKMQNEIVQLSRDNDELSLSVAELRSPTRIQQIAQDKLGMVLPDAFVFNSKGTTVEREVQVTKPIVD
ncbi:septum formation initiator family protein [uncultured Veillonella sp.]|uniref:septum formation initiator family protein n=1 Tax=uncultured Veillonella sp. TaxID=159268 RepID=UPI0025E8ECCE|nr:septum formation initiator family protein [uncultured Veillonella sp.]MDY3974075.1 septum formation initiator family protein [Veillonella caviae]